MSKQNKGSYHVSQFPKERIPTLDFLALGDNNHYVKSLIEVDVTLGRQCIRKHEEKTGIKLSFTGWLVSCIGKAASKHPAVHSMKWGKKVVKFDDVDISMTVEKVFQGKRAVMPLVVRKSNEKDVFKIHDEIRAAQGEKLDSASVFGDNKYKNKIKLYKSLPGWLRRWIIKRMLKNPFKAKEMMGTIVVTAVGMFGKVRGWPIPTTSHPLAIAIGGITEKPAIIDGEITPREFLTMTLLFNHDVVDGAPAARFVSDLAGMISMGYGLDS